jgi:hypothetical protein
MGILKETGETIVKYGEILVNKTEELAKIAKLNLDIKRMKIDQGIAEKELGRHVIEKIDQGAATIESSDAKVKEMHEKVVSLKKKIDEKKSEIEKVKMEAREPKKPEGGSQ